MARSSSKTARPRPNLLAIARSSSSGSVQPHAARPCIAGREVQHGRKLSRGTLAGLPQGHARRPQLGCDRGRGSRERERVHM